MTKHIEFAIAFLLIAITAASHVNAANRPQWIWAKGKREANQTVFLKSEFQIIPYKKITMRVIADSATAIVTWNGREIGRAEAFGPPVTIDLSHGLPIKSPDQKFQKLIIRATSHSESPAISVRIDSTGVFGNGDSYSMYTGEHWSASLTPEQDNWQPVATYGELADDPWGLPPDIDIDRFDDYTQWKRASNAKEGTNPTTFKVKPGYEVTLLRTAAKNESSWVSMTFDAKGRVLIGREDQGILRMTLGENEVAKVESINTLLKEPRGLLFVGKDLYVNANNSKTLFRLRDTNGDDQFDETVRIYYSGGSVGHGRNDLALGPDGFVYSIHGDSVDLPRDVVDHTSPFRKHSRGQKSKEGHVIRFHPGQEKPKIELFLSGLRNPYGIAFNADGEAFTYDADAEFDMGSPWYRPTRIRHLVRGVDYGWRGVTHQWPPYYCDHPFNPPSTFDIGKGSPTSVKFGTRSNFPGKYKDVFYALDWTYGRILAVHMTPRGSSYACRAETFLKGAPLNVTDLDFGPKGAMYLITGGRRTKSALYRIRYTGKPVIRTFTKQQKARIASSTKARRLRQSIEQGHQTPWPHLRSPDPWIRQAARIAIEREQEESWATNGIAQPDVNTALITMMSAARADGAKHAEVITRLMTRFRMKDMTTEQKLTALHALRLCEPHLSEKRKRASAIEMLAIYPDNNPAVNRELAYLTVRFWPQRAVGKTIDLLAKANTQKDEFHYLYVLRNVREGWTDEQRLFYFDVLNRTGNYLGGAGLRGFLSKIKKESLATLSETDRDKYAKLLVTQKLPVIDLTSTKRKIVKQWKMDELEPLLVQVSEDRSFENGKRAFSEAFCGHCHRVGLKGGTLGPDLSAVGSRFDRRTMLESMIEPSRVVSDKYASMKVTKTNGESIIGRVVQRGDYRSPTLHLMPNPLDPNQIIEIPKKDIAKHERVDVSPMPAGLINTLTQNEILDLLAYLESGGDKRREHFRK